MAEAAAIASIVGAGASLYGQATAKDPKLQGGFGNVQPPQDPTRFAQNLPNLLATLQNMRRSRGI